MLRAVGAQGMRSLIWRTRCWACRRLGLRGGTRSLEHSGLRCILTGFGFGVKESPRALQKAGVLRRDLLARLFRLFARALHLHERPNVSRKGLKVCCR